MSGQIARGAIGMKKRGDNIPVIVFWSVATFVSLWHLGTSELWGAEDRWAEVVREMQLTGDYSHPTLNGEPYFDKPLLSYWLIAAVSAVTGRLDEWAVRFPSVIAGLVALGATLNLGRRLWSEQCARTAGWILLSAFGFLFWARTGEADMENLAAIIGAVAWYWARRDKPGFGSYFVFYLICFVGAQAKGMAAIAVPFLVVFPDVIRKNRWRSYLSMGHFLALALGLSVYMAPFIYAQATQGHYSVSGLGMAIHENVTRYFQPFDHKEPFYVYFYYLPQAFFPWIPLLVAALWAALGSFRKLDWPTKWLTISTILIFVFFTLSGSRRSYYILPMLPFCALLAALYFDVERQERPRVWVLSTQTALLVVVIGLELLSPLGWPVLRQQTGFDAPKELVWATIFLGLMAALPLILERLRPGLAARITGAERVLAPLIVTSVVIVGSFLTWQQRITDTYRTLRPFCLALKHEIGYRGAEIAYFHKFPYELLFYLGSTELLQPVKNVEELHDFLNSPAETKVLITRSEFKEELARALPGGAATEPTLEETIYPWEKDPRKYAAWIIRHGAQ